MDMVIENRPTQTGVYFLQVPIPQMSQAQAQSKLENVIALPQQPGVFRSGMLIDVSTNGNERPLHYVEAKSRIESEGTFGNAYLSDKVALLGANDTAVAVGFYMIVETDIDLPPGLVDITKSVVNDKGRILYEEDSQGNRYTYPTEDLGLAFLPAIAALSVLFLAVWSVLAWFGLVQSPTSVFLSLGTPGDRTLLGKAVDKLQEVGSALQKGAYQAKKGLDETLEKAATLAKWGGLGLGIFLLYRIYQDNVAKKEKS